MPHRVLTAVPSGSITNNTIQGRFIGLIDGVGRLHDIPHNVESLWAIVQAETVAALRNDTVVCFDQAIVEFTGTRQAVTSYLAQTCLKVMGQTVLAATSAAVSVGNDCRVYAVADSVDIVAGDQCELFAGRCATIGAGSHCTIKVGLDSSVVAADYVTCTTTGPECNVSVGTFGRVTIGGSDAHIQGSFGSVICCSSPDCTINVSNGCEIFHPKSGAVVQTGEACVVHVGPDAKVVSGPQCKIVVGSGSIWSAGLGSTIGVWFSDPVTERLVLKSMTIDDQAFSSNTMYSLTTGGEFEIASQ
jgi:hypothetical protein